MKNLFIISEEEKERILNIHESATKRQYLKEEVVTITDNDKNYDYQKNGQTYFFRVKPTSTDKRALKYKDGNWHQATFGAINAIKALFDKKPMGTQKQAQPQQKQAQPQQKQVQPQQKPVTPTTPSDAAIKTATTSQQTIPQTIKSPDNTQTQNKEQSGGNSFSETDLNNIIA